MDTEADVAIIFYWRPGCGFCRRLHDGLEAAGVAFEMRNIWEDPDAAAFVRSVARGNETVPTVVVGETAMVNPTVGDVLALTIPPS
jgi:glutaredoxin-like protein